MKIEIAVPGRMMQSGSSLLRSIQNNNMPILDLFVRESIQNSLDAGKKGVNFVDVEFLTGMFSKKRLNEVLEGTEDGFNKRYKEDKYCYIAIRDSNTEGLTGPLDFETIQNNEYGNINKLIYSIGKPQQQEGAGGSWGLGKTVYYRVGVGVVIFYSRIKLANGQFQSRMAASFVEDELKEDSIIPGYHGKSKCGIAWWGCEVKGRENRTQPVTDEREIEKVLDIFGIAKYNSEKTGTTIIIPYVDKKILQDNSIQEDGRQGYWINDFDQFLRVSVQRWYAPRLDNMEFPYGCYLRTRINGVPLTSEDMEPTFKMVQNLYKCATLNNSETEKLKKEYGIETEEISLRGVLEQTTAGQIAYVKAKKEWLGMCPPENYASPMLYCNCEMEDTEMNRPLIFFTRKPGMIVSYEHMGAWVNGINKTESDFYIMGIFVLNSSNNMKPEYGKTLEGYVRDSEMADHNTWTDFTFENYNPRIISKIQGHVSKKISVQFEEEISGKKKKNVGLGNVIGQILLPPEGFGTRASTSGRNGTDGGTGISQRKSYSFKILEEETAYSAEGMEIQTESIIGKRIKGLIVELGINAESAIINYRDWIEKLGMAVPFEIESADITIKDSQTQSAVKEFTLNALNKSYDFEKGKSSLIFYDGKISGVSFAKYKEDDIVVADMSLRIRVHSRDINLQIRESWVR